MQDQASGSKCSKNNLTLLYDSSPFHRVSIREGIIILSFPSCPIPFENISLEIRKLEPLI